MKILYIPCLQGNYAYLVIDETTKEATAVDPVEPENILEVAKQNDAKLKMVLTTHHHWDHAGGNEKMRQLVPGIKVFGGSLDNVKGCIDKVDNGSISPEFVDTKMSRRRRKKNAERESTETSNRNPGQPLENHHHFSAFSDQIFRLLTNLAINYPKFADHVEYCDSSSAEFGNGYRRKLKAKRPQNRDKGLEKPILRRQIEVPTLHQSFVQAICPPLRSCLLTTEAKEAGKNMEANMKG
ncbi:hypothetical protein Ancab_002450 [Ancistrocladus abbreviatus]